MTDRMTARLLVLTVARFFISLTSHYQEALGSSCADRGVDCIFWNHGSNILPRVGTHGKEDNCAEENEATERK